MSAAAPKSDPEMDRSMGFSMGLGSALADERSGRVVFVSHCLLNENTRYPGGAFRSGAVTEVVEPFLREGVGLCQMPCPEEIAWGGVGKRHLVRFWGRPRAAWLARFGLPTFLAYTRWRYRLAARRVAGSIADYHANGMQVVGVVGVGASPSCGVATTVDVAAALDQVAGCPFDRLDRRIVNDAITAAARPGSGLFMQQLDRALARRALSVPLLEHDLRSEWPGSHLSPGAHPATLVVGRVDARPAAMTPVARKALRGRFDPARTEALIDATTRAIPSLESRVPSGLNWGGRHLLEQGVFVIGLHRALCAHGLPEPDATALISDVVFDTNRSAHAWLHRMAVVRSRNPWSRLRWQSRLLCRLYYRSPGWELHEVAVPAGFGLDVTRCAVADYFRSLGLGTLCEQTICAQDERVAQIYGGPVGIRFARKGTIAGGADRCDFRYLPATIGPMEE
jgi:hypothetical protein